jgi:DNA-directed RNA polymerase specialized sigma24 family protein
MLNDISALLEETEGSLEIIMRIADSLSEAYSSKILPKEDLQQEIFLFCVDAMTRYDGRAPLENFLRKHARNRLLNLIRFNKRRRVLHDTVDVDSLKEVLAYNPTDRMEGDELFAIINEELNTQERKVLIRMLDGVSVSINRKNHVREKVREIIERRAGDYTRAWQSNDGNGDSREAKS